MLMLATLGANDVSVLPIPAPVLAYQHMDNEHGDDMHQDEFMEARPRKKSYLMWMYGALGIRYTLLLPLSGLAVFLGACLVVALSRRPATIASYLVILPLPLLFGLFGTVEGLIAGWSVIGMSTTMPRMNELGELFSTALFTTFVGFLVNAPAYFVVAIGLPMRSIFAGDAK